MGSSLLLDTDLALAALASSSGGGGGGPGAFSGTPPFPQHPQPTDHHSQLIQDHSLTAGAMAVHPTAHGSAASPQMPSQPPLYGPFAARREAAAPEPRPGLMPQAGALPSGQLYAAAAPAQAPAGSDQLALVPWAPPLADAAPTATSPHLGCGPAAGALLGGPAPGPAPGPAAGPASDLVPPGNMAVVVHTGAVALGPGPGPALPLLQLQQQQPMPLALPGPAASLSGPGAPAAATFGQAEPHAAPAALHPLHPLAPGPTTASGTALALVPTVQPPAQLAAPAPAPQAAQPPASGTPAAPGHPPAAAAAPQDLFPELPPDLAAAAAAAASDVAHAQAAALLAAAEAGAAAAAVGDPSLFHSAVADALAVLGVEAPPPPPPPAPVPLTQAPLHPDVPMAARVGAVFAVYCLYATQLYGDGRPAVRVYVPLPLLGSLAVLLREAAEAGLREVVLVVRVSTAFLAC